MTSSLLVTRSTTELRGLLSASMKERVTSGIVKVVPSQLRNWDHPPGLTLLSRTCWSERVGLVEFPASGFLCCGGRKWSLTPPLPGSPKTPIQLASMGADHGASLVVYW